MASPTQWIWVWVNSWSWWWTGRPGVLQFTGLQRVGQDWATELNWTNMFHPQVIVPADLIVNKIDVIPDSLPTMDFLQLRNMWYSEIRNSNRITFSYLLWLTCPNPYYWYLLFVFKLILFLNLSENIITVWVYIYL